MSIQNNFDLSYQVGDSVVYTDDFMGDALEIITGKDGEFAEFNNGSRRCHFSMIRQAVFIEEALNRRVFSEEEQNLLKIVWFLGVNHSTPKNQVLIPREPTREIYQAYNVGFESEDARNTAERFKFGYAEIIKYVEQNA